MSGAEPPPLVVQSEELDAEAASWLAQRARLERVRYDDAAFDDALRECQGLVVRTYTRVDNALLDRAPRLRVVGRAGVGLDNIDLDACAARDVAVVHTPDANTRAVVELVTAFMLDALRPRVFLDRALDAERWRELRRDLIAERQLCELRLGVLGFGRVGSRVARVGRALDMRVRCCDLRTIPASDRDDIEQVDIDELFATSDVLSVHVDGRPENRRLVDLPQLRLLPDGAVFINTSRGMVVDGLGLAAWLKSDGSAQAILDVHEPEPVADDDPLLTLENAHLTPHIGAATRLAHRNMSWVVRDVWRVLAGEPPEFAAVRPAPASR